MINRNILFFIALILASFNLRPGITSISPVLNGIATELDMSTTLARFTHFSPFSMYWFLFTICRSFSKPLSIRKGYNYLYSLYRVCNISTHFHQFSNIFIDNCLINWCRNRCCKSFNLWFYQKLLSRESSLYDRYLLYLNGSRCIHCYWVY